MDRLKRLSAARCPLSVNFSWEHGFYERYITPNGIGALVENFFACVGGQRNRGPVSLLPHDHHVVIRKNHRLGNSLFGHTQALERIVGERLHGLLETTVHRIVRIDHLPVGGGVPQVPGDQGLKAKCDKVV